MPIKPAQRTEKVIYAIRNIVTYAKNIEKEKGIKVTYLNIGDPLIYDFETPQEMIEAAFASMRKGQNGYASSYGTDEARQTIADFELKKNKKNIVAEDVIVTSGASEGIELALTALVNAGENILLPSPGYPLYDAVTGKIGAEKRSYRLDPHKNWAPDIQHIESLIDEKTRAIIVINPNNPTGVLYDSQTMKAILDLCRKYNLVYFSDEIYDGMLFDNLKMSYPSTLVNDVPIISFNGLSKNYLAPGWRMGWMVFQNMKNETDYIAAIRRLAEARLCSCSPLQNAILAALKGNHAHIKPTLEKLQRRRDITFERLNAIPRVSCVKPQAAFYAMPIVEGIKDDEKFVKQLVSDTGVLFVHGSGFGLPKDMGAFRVVFLPDENTLHSAFDRLEKFLKTYHQ